MKAVVGWGNASTALIPMIDHYIYLAPWRGATRTIVNDRDGSSDDMPMTAREFTDAENTGAPLVPMITDPDVATDGGQPEAEYLEEVIWSHRRPE